MSIYESVRGATLDAPFGAAQSVILLITAGGLLALSQWVTSRAEKRR